MLCVIEDRRAITRIQLNFFAGLILRAHWVLLAFRSPPRLRSDGETATIRTDQS